MKPLLFIIPCFLLTSCGSNPKTSLLNNQHSLFAALPSILLGKIPTHLITPGNKKTPLFSRYENTRANSPLELSTAFADIPKTARKPLLILQDFARASDCLFQKIPQLNILLKSANSINDLSSPAGSVKFAIFEILNLIKEHNCGDLAVTEPSPLELSNDEAQIFWDEQGILLTLSQLKIQNWQWNAISIKLSKKDSNINPQVQMHGFYKTQSFSLNFNSPEDWSVTEGSNLCSSTDHLSCAQFFPP